MKTKKQWIGSIIAVALLGTVASIDAAPTRVRVTRQGWWIRVNASKTEASVISFQIGTNIIDRRAWRTWRPGEAAEFDVPDDFLRDAKLYIRATAAPRKKHAWFCVFYQNRGVRHFHFDGDESHILRQHDFDDECNH
jgi:hypothetical protein